MRVVLHPKYEQRIQEIIESSAETIKETTKVYTYNLRSLSKETKNKIFNEIADLLDNYIVASDNDLLSLEAQLMALNVLARAMTDITKIVRHYFKGDSVSCANSAASPATASTMSCWTRIVTAT